MQGRSAAIGMIFAIVLACGTATVAPARAEDAPADAAAARKSRQERPPVSISSDVAEYHNKDNRVIFSGNVVATQEDATLTADRMELVFSSEQTAEAPAGATGATGATGAAVGVIGEPSGGRRIKSLTAIDHVSFRQIDPETKKERYATGEKAVYDADKQEVTMFGNPKLWEGKNVITGEEMIFTIEGRDVVFKGKVNLTVFPDEVKQEKKP